MEVPILSVAFIAGSVVAMMGVIMFAIYVLAANFKSEENEKS